MMNLPEDYLGNFTQKIQESPAKDKGFHGSILGTPVINLREDENIVIARETEGFILIRGSEDVPAKCHEFYSSRVDLDYELESIRIIKDFSKNSQIKAVSAYRDGPSDFVTIEGLNRYIDVQIVIELRSETGADLWTTEGIYGTNASYWYKVLSSLFHRKYTAQEIGEIVRPVFIDFLRSIDTD
jgi:hypothetical protein